MRSSAQITLGFLALTMMVKALMVPIVYIDFKLNQDYIARVLCINRDKPEMKCNGHCILMQKLKKARQTEESQNKQENKKQNFETFCESLMVYSARTFPPKPKKFGIYQFIFTSNYSSDIFHPPQLQA